MDQVKLLEKLKQDLLAAVKKQDKVKITTLRLLLSDINYQKIANRGNLSNDDVTAVVYKQVKKHQESINLYKKAQRDDLVQKEKQELDIISSYLPQQLSDLQIEKIVDKIISQVKPSGPQDFGKVMGQLMPEIKGKADGKQVSRLVREKLNG